MRGRRVLIIAGILALLLSAPALLWFWACHRDPLAALPPPEHGLQADRQALPAPDGRTVSRLTLHGKSLGDIVFTLSLPEPLPQAKLPLVLVLAGLATAENSLRYIQDPGDNAVAAYAWPVPSRLAGAAAALRQGPQIYRRVLAVPGQAVSILHWLRAQPWADGGRVSLLGYSLGALAAPAVLDVAGHDGIHVGWTIIAYGGAPLGAVLAANPSLKPPWLRRALAPLLDLALHPLEPTLHLPRVSGKFLVLQGQDDGLIPGAARDRLKAAVPDPKTIITFEGTHMGVGPQKMALLQEIIAASKRWLMENGAVNPVPF
jgi:dienelactone hydrolase